MRLLPRWIAFCTIVLAFSSLSQAADPPRFDWKDGDRVVLIGDTLIERDQRYGYLETLITAQNPDKSITFRNLGWSGDTVRGLSRARFGPPIEGFQHLKDHVVALKPTVLIVGYGMADSFDGESGLHAFVSGLNELLDAVTVSKPRLIFLSPIAHEDLGRPLPDPAKHNRNLARYRDAVKTIAEERNAWFVDLFEPTRAADGHPAPLTDNGIHPTEFGHYFVDTIVARTLQGLKAFPVEEIVLPSGSGPTARPPKLPVLQVALPVPPFPPDSPNGLSHIGVPRKVSCAGLKGGRYTLFIDGRAVETADAVDWASGVPIAVGQELFQVRTLRRTINAKNALYFYRWRPQNETYLFGFRKHEQGNNAREIPLFDPLVEEKEKEIARLKKPVPHVYELIRESEAAK